MDLEEKEAVETKVDEPGAVEEEKPETDLPERDEERDRGRIVLRFY